MTCRSRSNRKVWNALPRAHVSSRIWHEPEAEDAVNQSRWQTYFAAPDS